MAPSREAPETGIFGEIAQSQEGGGACAPSSPPVSRMFPRVPKRELSVLAAAGHPARRRNNALSVARSLSKVGIKVYAINRPGTSAPSRYLTRIAVPGDRQLGELARLPPVRGVRPSQRGGDLLLQRRGHQARHRELAGVFRALRDGALPARHAPQPARQALYLRKGQRMRHRASNFWPEPDQGVAEVGACRFPVILKPRLSQHWRLIGAKYLRADNRGN